MAKTIECNDFFKLHEATIKDNKKKHEIATASRSKLRKKDEELESRMNKWSYIATGFSLCFIAISGFTSAIVMGFWWLIGNGPIMAALTAVKDAD